MNLSQGKNFLYSGKLQDFTIKITNNTIWNKYKINDGIIYYTGSIDLVEKLKNQYVGKKFSEKKIKKFLLHHNRNTSIIMKINDSFLMITSFSRDNQIFFRLKKKTIYQQ